METQPTKRSYNRRTTEERLADLQEQMQAIQLKAAQSDAAAIPETAEFAAALKGMQSESAHAAKLLSTSNPSLSVDIRRIGAQIKLAHLEALKRLSEAQQAYKAAIAPLYEKAIGEIVSANEEDRATVQQDQTEAISNALTSEHQEIAEALAEARQQFEIADGIHTQWVQAGKSRTRGENLSYYEEFLSSIDAPEQEQTEAA